MVSVKWMDFGPERPVEPFFAQTIKRLRSGAAQAPECTTDLSTLIAAGEALKPIVPAGLIFHVSRCGSTLVANAMRANPDVTVLSEAWPIELFFRPDYMARAPFIPEAMEDMRRILVGCVANYYGGLAGTERGALVIKFHAADLTQFSLIRSVWPCVPAVIVIRDPVEIIVSNLAKPAPWVTWRTQPELAQKVFSWKDIDTTRLSVEEYCARALGRLFEIAGSSLDATCRLVDYEKLDRNMIGRIAEFFGLSLTTQGEMPDQLFSQWSKDPEGVRTFEPDSSRKRAEASDALRGAVRDWALNGYERLRSLDVW